MECEHRVFVIWSTHRALDLSLNELGMIMGGDVFSCCDSEAVLNVMTDSKSQGGTSISPFTHSLTHRRNRLEHGILVPGWLITTHVT